jgi:hypothetical protein
MGMSIEEKTEILKYWNSKKIIVHRKLTPDISTEISRIGKYYSVEEIKEFIDFYETILEPGVPENQKKYFWTYKWNLYEFLKRGLKKFDGQEPKNYLKKQFVAQTEAIVFTRN